MLQGIETGAGAEMILGLRESMPPDRFEQRMARRHPF